MRCDHSFTHGASHATQEPSVFSVALRPHISPSMTMGSGSSSVLLGRATFSDPADPVFKVKRITGDWQMRSSRSLHSISRFRRSRSSRADRVDGTVITAPGNCHLDMSFMLSVGSASISRFRGSIPAFVGRADTTTLIRCSPGLMRCMAR